MDVSPATTPGLFLPDSRAGQVYGAVSVPIAVAAVAVSLRFYTRGVIIKHLGLDDWLALVALLLFLSMAAASLAMTVHGLGRHIGTLPRPDGIKVYLRDFFFSIVFYNCANSAVKLCFLAHYYRIIPLKKMRRAVLVITAVVGAWFVSQIGLSIFNCTPVWGFWDKRPGVNCLPPNPGWYINSAGNIATDLIILVIPLPVVRGLNLPHRQKAILVGIFCLGFFTCAISVSRIRFLPVTLDTTWDTVDSQIWSLAEISSGIVCASIPTLRPLASRWFPNMLGSTRSNPSQHKASRSWRPRDTESSHRSRASRCIIRRFTGVATGDSKTTTNQTVTQVGGSAYLELSGDSIELQDSHVRHGEDRRLPPADVAYGGPVAHMPGLAVGVPGGRVSRPEPAVQFPPREARIRVRHDIVVDNGNW